MESICMTVLVGLAVDYSMHIAIAFVDSPQRQTRRVRTVEALSHIAISVVGGACSTLGCSFFLFFCTYSASGCDCSCDCFCALQELRRRCKLMKLLSSIC